MNDGNLMRPKSDLTPEQLHELTSKAGKAAARKRRERKELREIAKIVLSAPLDEGELDDIEGMTVEEYPDHNITVAEASMFRIAKKALRGDIAALAFLRDTAGERPAEQVEVSTDVARATEEIRRLIDEKRADGKPEA